MITYDTYNIYEEIEKFARLQQEYKEKALAELIAKYDFIVGSEESKHKLMEVLPEGVNIVCSPYIEDSAIIYAIKRFDVMDLLIEPQESESE